MPDVIDVILDKLSHSPLELLDEINFNWNRESEYYSEELEKNLDSMESDYFNKCVVELNNKTDLLMSKTRKYKKLFDKFNEQFKEFQNGMSNCNSKKMEAYNERLNCLEERMNKLTMESGDFEPEKLFVNIDDMHKKIEDLGKNIEEIKERLKCYENFPASITEGQCCLNDLKARIKEKETTLERNLY